MKETFVIIGNGIAGLTAAKTIRDLNKECKIVLIGDEPYLTYSRPMITKAPIVGFDISKFIIHNKEWYIENNITILTDIKAESICNDTKIVTLSNGNELKYDKCILATGSESFVPPIPGADKQGVFVARKIDDIANMRLYRLKCKNAVVIGGGVIGLEAAWELKKSGLNVVVLEQASNLMGRLLDTQSAQALKDIVVSQGITVVNDVQIDRIDGNNKSEKVILKDGTAYDADIVILSCGIKPNVEIAKTAGVNVGRSIIVDKYMKTNVEDIYACGDCAEYNGMNLALWEQSVKQGEIAAKNACGEIAEYDQIKTNLIFNGIKTSLYTVGDIGKDETLEYKDVVIESNDKQTKYFMINNPNQLGYTYEKYYFSNDVIVGGVLIGDLSKKNILKDSIEEKASYEIFMKRLNKENGGSL